MANRLIRDGILDSERYWSVTIEAKLLFFHLMLVADDIGCLSLAPIFVRRHCFDDRPSDEKVAKLLQELADADLVRIYMHDGARYGFIPRFRQRLQRCTLKYPEPPAELLKGDDDAQKKLIKIKHNPPNPTVGQRLSTVGQRCEMEVEVEEKKQLHGVIGDANHPRPSPPSCPHERIVALYHESLPSLPQVRHWTKTRQVYLANRWREQVAAGEYATVEEGLTWWAKLFAYVGRSKFLTGRVEARDGRRPFLADLEWLVKPSNFVKVIEGKYDDAEAHLAA